VIFDEAAQARKIVDTRSLPQAPSRAADPRLPFALDALSAAAVLASYS
jgi:hypothetical protein